MDYLTATCVEELKKRERDAREIAHRTSLDEKVDHVGSIMQINSLWVCCYLCGLIRINETREARDKKG